MRNEKLMEEERRAKIEREARESQQRDIQRMIDYREEMKRQKVENE